ncbi:hypothetical protein STEG23_019142 [Scotinomys teguina]
MSLPESSYPTTATADIPLQQPLISHYSNCCYPTTATPEYSNMAEAQENDLRTNFMKMIEELKEKVDKTVKEIEEKVIKNLEEINKSLKEIKKTTIVTMKFEGNE